MRAKLKSTSWSEICEDSGVSEAEIRHFADLYAKAKTAVFVYSMGLTQYEFGVDNVKMVVQLITPVALAQQQRFAIREGGKTVGAGVVTKILE